MTDRILFATHGRTAVLTLNRPDALNALDFALLDELMRQLDAIEAAPNIAVVILTGAGPRAFSAGADIKEFRRSVKEGRWQAIRDFVTRGQSVTVRLERVTKPIVAAVNGLAYGGGCEIVEAVHLVVASEQATFAKPEIKLGMPPTFGGTQRLPRLIGRRRALEMLLSGEAIDARRALAIGLVNDVVAPEHLHEAALALARRLGDLSSTACRGIMDAVGRGMDTTIAEGLQIEAAHFAELVPRHDLAEGLDAWIEKRAKRFAHALGGGG